MQPCWRISLRVSTVFRAVRREPNCLSVFLGHVNEARGADRRLDGFAARLEKELADPSEQEARARRVVEMMALTIQAALVVRHSPPAVADAFCASRLGGDWGQAFGTLPAGLPLDQVIKRAQVGL